MFFFLNPTVTASEDFEPLREAFALRQAMKGDGTDKDIIVDILTQRNNKQRRLITAAYRAEFDRDLLEDLNEELHFNFKKLITALMVRPVEFLADEIHDAIEGIGTDEETLIEILCSRDNWGINKIVNAYNEKYGDLAQDLANDTSGKLRLMLIPIVTGNREDTIEYDAQRANEQAHELFNAGENRWGTDESVFARIFGQENFHHLNIVFREYEGIAGNTIEEAIESELSGDLKDATLTIVKCINNTAKYFAERLRHAMKGIGTKNDILIRIIVTRAELDLGNIKEEYENMYGKSLREAVDDDTRGEYSRALLNLIN
jgi:annexin A7/11